MVEKLWKAMEVGEFAYAIQQAVKSFNGITQLHREEIGELVTAASYNWREVEPTKFGTLLEQDLRPAERAQLGAHYAPRACVESFVLVTVIEPLRQEWAQV